MRDSLNRVAALTVRNLKEIVRDPLSLIFMALMPLVMEIMFYLLFHTQTSQFEMKYLAPGIMVFSQAFLALFSGLLIALDRSTAFLTRLFVSRTAAREFILGYLLALLPLAMVQSVLFFIVGGIIEPSLFGAGMVRGVLLALVTSLLFIGAGILIGTFCGEKSVGGVASVLIMCQSMLSGMWFPAEGISKGMVTLMNCLPFKNAVALVQNAVNGVPASFETFWRPLLIVLAYTVPVFALAVFCFNKKMKAN